MTVPNSAIDVLPKQIRYLDKDKLKSLMRRLFDAEGCVCDIDSSELLVTDNIDADDDGCDGWSPVHSGRTDWLPPTKTCWQFRAGKKGRPAALKGEVTKKIPRETLVEGGFYIVVASDASGKGGRGGKDARLNVPRVLLSHLASTLLWSCKVNELVHEIHERLMG